MATIKELQATIKRLEARVRELEDDRAIRELLARYGYTADGCKDEAYLDLFTEDGAMDLSTGGLSGYQGVVRWDGKKRLRDFITDPAGHHRKGFYGNAMHVQGNNVVTHIKGNEAVVNSYSLVLEGKGSGVDLISAGNNQWKLKKVKGKWLFQERRRRQVGDPEYTKNLDATPR